MMILRDSICLLVILTILSSFCDNIFSQQTNQLNETRNASRRQRPMHSQRMPSVSGNATGTRDRQRNDRAYGDREYVRGGRQSTSSLFNFDCGNRYEPLDGSLRVKRFIAGGYDAGLYSYPSYMKIMVSVSGFMYNKCGGTLISRNHIITATHCFPRRHGEVFAESTIYQRPSQTRLPIAKVCHLGIPTSDITILRLKNTIRFSLTCQPACLPDRPLTSSMRAITVGLGANHISKSNPNKIQNPDELQALPVRRSECKWHDKDKAHICFRPDMEEFMGASCKGDSGGPTYAEVDGKQTVYSVVSYGSDHICQAGKPGYSVNGDIYNLKNPIINLMKAC